jgi:hypothetical protein
MKRVTVVTKLLTYYVREKYLHVYSLPKNDYLKFCFSFFLNKIQNNKNLLLARPCKKIRSAFLKCCYSELENILLRFFVSMCHDKR